jgi:signal transduction histidine kinase
MKTRGFRDLPLFWKLLLPFVGLLLFTGAFGTFIVVRDLSERAQTAVDQELSQRSFDARQIIHDTELYLLEAANFASNIRGISDAIDAHDASAVRQLLRSVVALKSELTLMAVTDRTGRGIAEFSAEGDASPRLVSPSDWRSEQLVRSALGSPDGHRSSGFVRTGGRTILAIAGPVCSAAEGCRASGVAIAGIEVGQLAAEASGRPSSADLGTGSIGVGIYALNGHPLAAAGRGVPQSIDRGQPSPVWRVTSGDLETLYGPLEIQGRAAGTLAVTISRSFAFGAVRGTAIRLALIVLATMIGVATVLGVVSRLILTQVRPLVATNRALGAGDLASRVPVKSNDELGELARGVNHMAEQLQASYENLEAKVAERTDEVSRLLAQRTEFFTSLSHDFRTPLAVILSEADLLQDSSQRITRRQADEAGATLRASGEQLLRSINEILDIAQADAGGLEVDLSDVRLADVLDDIRPTIEGLTKGNGLTFSVHLPRSLPKVVADRSRLREVLINLVDNAVKYTPTGGVIDITAGSRNGSVEVSVADNGLGIPPDVGDRIFEPFFRVSGAKPFRGQASSGLGLAVAKRFVEAQGGHISFTARPEGGTVFSVVLQRTSK